MYTNHIMSKILDSRKKEKHYKLNIKKMMLWKLLLIVDIYERYIHMIRTNSFQCLIDHHIWLTNSNNI
ncbi:hypothetical protein AQUCO_00300719v1 [Aquilegia coerulea]|uniref:Uncharacterized protein n=1 Tax=Aquilegia coerulea TaxID=218851 RepID=A0A2G5F058_AQUCA|nr:hypothetical protein AQUCO_00300719v1 [Aquilegia coerulea]